MAFMLKVWKFGDGRMSRIVSCTINCSLCNHTGTLTFAWKTNRRSYSCRFTIRIQEWDRTYITPHLNNPIDDPLLVDRYHCRITQTDPKRSASTHK